MLKSLLAITVVGLGLKDIKAVWAMMFIGAASVASTIHLVLHHHLGAIRALGDLTFIDTVGGLAYFIGVILF